MKRSVFAAVLLATGLGFAGAAQAAQPGPAACLQPNRFWSWKDIDNRTVVVTDRMRRDYKLSLQPGCYDLNFAFNIGVKSFSTSSLSCVTRGDYVIVPRQMGSFQQRCYINKVEPYTAEMAKADALALEAKKQQH